MNTYSHPSFARAALVTGRFAGHFPTSVAEAAVWAPIRIKRALAPRVLAVAQTRIECTWRAYIDATTGTNHDDEQHRVADFGVALDEPIARALFPQFEGIVYAK